MKSNHSQDIKNSTAIGGTALKTSFTAQYVYGRKYQIRIWKKISPFLKRDAMGDR